MAKPDGGPAFPYKVIDCSIKGAPAIRWNQSGMSLRDYFAGQALAGWLAHGSVARIIEQHNTSAAGALTVLAGGCYQAADAMLAARERD